MFCYGETNVGNKYKGKWNSTLGDFWEYQIKLGKVQAKPFSGNCMFCNEAIKETDDDHSVCNKCWLEKLGEESD